MNTGFLSIIKEETQTILLDAVVVFSDFYPISRFLLILKPALFMKKGVLAGIEQTLSIENSMNSSLFRIQSKVMN